MVRLIVKLSKGDNILTDIADSCFYPDKLTNGLSGTLDAAPPELMRVIMEEGLRILSIHREIELKRQVGLFVRRGDDWATR